MSAIAEFTAAPSSPAGTAWSSRLAALDRGQRLRLALGVVVLVVVAVAGMVLGRQAEWRVLYSNVADRDGGAIVAQLATMNVPYKYSEGGGAILVPADRVHDTRLRLAAQGLPKGSVAGFELMENSRFGMTQFQERLTFQRGLEGELTRSIQSLSSVQTARVHLALPNQNGFFREQQKPSASVLVTLHAGRTLERAQIAGIVHLVASSVPELATGAVSVLDDSGKLLSTAPDGAGGGSGDAQQLQYVQQIEQLYSRRILDMLEPVVGRQNVKAQVTADVDFTQTESTSEQHRPNQGTDAGAVRSQQVVESTGPASGAAGGIPGAVSNQPPATSSAPINGTAAALSPAAGAANGAAAAGGERKREAITNYEVDKTVKVVRGSSGVVRRLSAAVVVNYQPLPAGPGGVVKPGGQALSAQQIEQMTALVRESIGFNKDRGDSVNLMNTPFQVDARAVVDLPLWKQPETLDLARSMAWPVGTLLLATVLLLGFVRPAIKAMGRAVPVPAGRQLNAVVEEDTPRAALPAPSDTPVLLPATAEQLRLEGARHLAKSNPTAVANIVKNWVSGDVPA